MPIETVIFDLGGTLIEYAGEYDSWPELETPGFLAAYEMFKRNGRSMPSFDEFKQAGFALIPVMWQSAVRHQKNLTVKGLLRNTMMSVGIIKITEMELDFAAASYGYAIQLQARVIDQAKETVAGIKAAGYKVGLVSNTMFPGKMHQDDMHRFELLGYFDAMVFSADVAKWKPNAAPFLDVLSQLDATPETAVYVGDDPASDVAGGQAAGMHTIFFHSSNRFAKPDHLQPTAEIKALSDLLPLLSSVA